MRTARTRPPRKLSPSPTRTDVAGLVTRTAVHPHRAVGDQPRGGAARLAEAGLPEPLVEADRSGSARLIRAPASAAQLERHQRRERIVRVDRLLRPRRPLRLALRVAGGARPLLGPRPSAARARRALPACRLPGRGLRAGRGRFPAARAGAPAACGPQTRRLSVSSRRASRPARPPDLGGISELGGCVGGRRRFAHRISGLRRHRIAVGCGSGTSASCIEGSGRRRLDRTAPRPAGSAAGGCSGCGPGTGGSCGGGARAGSSDRRLARRLLGRAAPRGRARARPGLGVAGCTRAGFGRGRGHVSGVGRGRRLRLTGSPADSRRRWPRPPSRGSPGAASGGCLGRAT